MVKLYEQIGICEIVVCGVVAAAVERCVVRGSLLFVSCGVDASAAAARERVCNARSRDGRG